MKLLVVVSVATALTACAANSGVTRTGQDTFLVSRQAATGLSGSGTLKADALKEADAYCTANKKMIEVISTDEAKPPFVFGNFPKAEVKFKCLKPEP